MLGGGAVRSEPEDLPSGYPICCLVERALRPSLYARNSTSAVLPPWSPAPETTERDA